jgi:hypothetical protein
VTDGARRAQHVTKNEEIVFRLQYVCDTVRMNEVRNLERRLNDQDL